MVGDSVNNCYETEPYSLFPHGIKEGTVTNLQYHLGNETWLPYKGLYKTRSPLQVILALAEKEGKKGRLPTNPIMLRSFRSKPIAANRRTTKNNWFSWWQRGAGHGLPGYMESLEGYHDL